MLQGLELADQLPELFAGAQIGHGRLEGLIPGPVQRRRRAGPAEVQRPFQQGLAPIDRPDHRIRIDLDIRQRHPRGIVRIDHDGPLDRDPRRLRIDKEQAQPVLRQGRDDQGVGHMAVQHEALGPVQLEAVARPLRHGRDPRRRMLRPLVHRQRDDRLARRDPGQPGRLLLGRAALQHRRRKHARPQEGRGRQRPAQSLRHHPGLNRAEARAAVLLRDDDPRKPHLAKGPPQVARDPVGILRVAQLAQMRDRRVLIEEAVGGLLEHGLFFGQDQGHCRLFFLVVILGLVPRIRLSVAR